MIRKLLRPFAVLFVLTAFAGAQTFSGVLTQHNDNSRSGQNLFETTLTPQNVNTSTFGKVYSFSVDGQIYAQPLYVPNVTIGSVSHNIIVVATEYDSIYAFDAEPDLAGHTTTALWHHSFINLAKGVQPVPCGSQGSTTDISCNVFPFYGITGTPVVDPVTLVMYLVVRTAETTSGVTNYYQRLHAINLKTGGDISGSPVVISGEVPGTGAGSVNGMVPYDPLADIQRVGLTLSNGTVYIGWAGAAHGWIMAYNEKTLKQTGIFNTAPNAVLGGVWQSGNGFVADSSGNIYAAVGDATFDANTGGVDYGDSLVELNSSLQVVNYFTPMDEACRTTGTNDLDLGSGGPLLLSTQGGKYPDEILTIGKSGTGFSGTGCDTSDMYLLNQADLGGYSTTDAAVLQELTDPPGGTAQGFWSDAAFWQGTESASGTSGTSYIYVAGTTTGQDGNAGGPLDQYAIKAVTGTSTAKLSFSASSTNAFPQGATPSVSSNGSNDGIVWVIERSDSLDLQPGDNPAILFAYDATNVGNMLYRSNGTNPKRDELGCANKFQTPTIANGRVYVGTQTQLDIFGLLNGGTGETLYLSNMCNTYPSTPVGQKSAPFVVTLTNTGTTTLNITSVILTGPNAPDFNKGLSNKCGKTLAANASCNISVSFSPSTGQPEIAYLTINDSSIGSPHNVRLVGTGDQPSLNVTPPYLAFGKQDVNIASAPQTVTVANSGNLPVTLTSFTFTGTNANLFTQTNNCPASLAVNANCTVNVTFTPQVTGQFSANLSIADNATGSPQLVNLTGVGVQPNAVITAPNPPQINFGQIALGKSSAPQPVTLLNNGGGTLFITSINFSGPNPTEFSETDNCGTQLASGASCTINVTFTPSAAGLAQAYLNVNDNSSPSPQQVSLSGDGT